MTAIKGKRRISMAREMAALGAMLSVVAAMLLGGASLGAPMISENPDGTSTVSWTFSDPADYTRTNATTSPGSARLSLKPCDWTLDTAADFQGGNMTETVVDGAGSVLLNLTAPTELLVNGNFTSSPDGTSAPPWSWATYVADSAAGTQARNTVNGHVDDGPCWNNTFWDYDSGARGEIRVWLNQSFALPTLPSSVNISAMHRLVNIGPGFLPGAAANLSVLSAVSNLTSGATGTGWHNETTVYAEICEELSSSFFNATGTYTLSLATVTNTSADIAYATGDFAVFHLWDDASVKYTAYHPKGRYVSRLFDAGSPSFWKNASWLSTEPFGSNVTLKVRSGNSNNTYDSSWSPWSNELPDPAGSELFLLPTRYIQFMADFETDYTNRSPSLDRLVISYEQYHTEGFVVTDDFVPPDVKNWGYFSHSEVLDGQTVSYEVSTDGGATWGPIPEDGDLRALAVNAASPRIRVRATLRTNETSSTPSIESMEIRFVGANPSITLECAWSDPTPNPGDSLRLETYVNNSAAQTASFAWLNVTLPSSGLAYVSWGSDSVGLHITSQQYDAGTSTARFGFAELRQGSYHAWIEVSVSAGVEDGAALASNATLSYTDPLGVTVASSQAQFSVAPTAPSVSVWTESPSGSLDFGEIAHYRVHVNNTGGGPSPKVWLNGSLDERLAYVNSSGGLHDGGEVMWLLEDLDARESRTLYVNASIGSGATHNSTLAVGFVAKYIDTAGFVRTSSDNQPEVTTGFASNMSFAFVCSVAVAHPGDNIVATGYYNNSGYGVALMVSVKITMPETLALNGSNQQYEESGRAAYWNFSDVGPGPHSFAVTFEALDIGASTSSASIVAEMSVIDQVHGAIGVVGEGEASVVVERIPTIWEKIFWPWSGLGAGAALAGLAIALWWAYAPTPPGITDVLFIYRDGRLISHRSAASSMRKELDSDLVSSMLTAVQQFVSDSLSEEGQDRVKKLEFGDKEIFIERGANTYLAVIYTGDMSKRLNSNIRELIAHIEADYPALDEWNGKMTGLESISSMLDKMVSDWQRPRNGKQASLSEVDKV